MKKFIVYSKNFTCDLISICFCGDTFEEAKDAFLNKFKKMLLTKVPNHHYITLGEVTLSSEQIDLLAQLKIDEPYSALPEYLADELSDIATLIGAISASKTLLAEAVTNFDDSWVSAYCATADKSFEEVKRELTTPLSYSIREQIIQNYFEKYYLDN